MAWSICNISYIRVFRRMFSDRKQNSLKAFFLNHHPTKDISMRIFTIYVITSHPTDDNTVTNSSSCFTNIKSFHQKMDWIEAKIYFLCLGKVSFNIWVWNFPIRVQFLKGGKRKIKMNNFHYGGLNETLNVLESW